VRVNVEFSKFDPGSLEIYHSLSYSFARFQKRERIPDTSLTMAVWNAESGLVDADLGGGLIKQRVARPGRGKSGGFRTIIACRRGGRAVFLFGFAKSERASLDRNELVELRHIGQVYLDLDDRGLLAAMAADELMEVTDVTED
jgi:hypothetical protein